MGDVVDIDSMRRHLTVPTMDGNVHVLPCSIVEDVIDGKLPPAAILCLEDGNELMRTIVAEWYGRVHNDGM